MDISQEDLTSLVWKFPEFLAAGPLSVTNVMEYFSLSPFWDRQSTNQALKMQTQFTGRPVLNEVEELKRFVGVEFALVHSAAPSIFVIHKRRRLSPIESNAITAYYVINESIYQAPGLYHVISARLLTTIDSLRHSLDLIQSKAPVYSPRRPQLFEIEEKLAIPSSEAAPLPDGPVTPPDQALAAIDSNTDTKLSADPKSKEEKAKTLQNAQTAWAMQRALDTTIASIWPT